MRVILISVAIVAPLTYVKLLAIGSDAVTMITKSV